MGRIWSTVSRRVRRRLALGALAAVVLPLLAGEIVKQLQQLPAHAAQIVDFVVLGSMGFGLTMVVTAMFGCLLVAAMKGPAHRGDDFPAARDR